MIKGDSVYLRALEPEDIEQIYLWENNMSVWKVSNTLVPYSKSILQKYIESSANDIYTAKQLRMMICNFNNKPIGCIDLFDFDPYHMRAGIGVLIADEADRKKGYAAESLRLLTNYCFNILQLNQVFCNIAIDNEDSMHLFESAGFKRCGIKKSWVRDGKSYKDEVMYQFFGVIIDEK